jgi:hypothetical protein
VFVVKSEWQSQLVTSIYAVLRPLARLLIRSGITYKQFAELSKLAFIEEALAESTIGAKKANDSRIAAKTGISRKEIRRIKQINESDPVIARCLGVEQNGVLARVLHRWHFDPQYSDGAGATKDLEFDTGPCSFSELVRGFAGDIPIGAIRAELLEVGAIEIGDNGTLRALKNYYVPRDIDDKIVSALSWVLFPVAEGIVHNSEPTATGHTFIQRFAFSEALSPDGLKEFRGWTREAAGSFMLTVDRWLAENESTLGPSVADPLPGHAGVGVFYYEGPTAADRIRPTTRDA